MEMRDVDAVMAIESLAYAYPWSRGNFQDSLASGYEAQVLVNAQGQILGYYLALLGVDELHILNVTIAPEFQRLGLGRALLEAVVRDARRLGAASVWLEVRASNERAQRVYERFGFSAVGQRKGYYPAADGQRENALIMSLAVNDDS
jgi:ribosomal-protein-alanine N-acetyltransferase